MSLISIRNLAGPLRSKLQMGALAIVIILVLVIRLGTSRGQREETSEDTMAQGSQELLKVLKESKKPKTPTRESPKDDLLDGLVAEGLDEQPVQDVEEPSNGESFDDIRKSLGLE